MSATEQSDSFWDGKRWVDRSGRYWWDGHNWTPALVELGQYWITVDTTLWFDGSQWRPIGDRPSRAGILALGIVSAVAVLGTIAVLIAGTASSACSPSAPGLEGTACAFDWLAFVGLAGGIDATLVAFSFIRWRRRYRPTNIPLALAQLLNARR